jgi:hypothetical protein
MTIPEILKELELYTGQFPMAAMRAAVAQREAITPELLRVVEAVAAAPAEHAQREDYMLHHFAVHLLAQFREKRTYPSLVRMVSAPGELPFDLLGDTVTEGLGQLLASVYDGDRAPLQRLVESGAVNEFVRDAALKAFLVLEHSGQMPRAEVVEYFRSLFHGKLERTHSYAWAALICAVANMPAPELLEEVRQAYAEGLVDESVSDLKSLERDIAAPPAWRHERHCPLNDAIAEMEWWASFHPEDSHPHGLPQFDPPAPLSATSDSFSSSYHPPEPFVRELKSGPNDPCPCGSGKKYKKCCGQG